MVKKKLNKFEETRLFSSRAAEIAEGAEVKVDVSEIDMKMNRNFHKVARKEFEEDKLDLEIYK